MQKKIPAVIMRGGTSRAVLFKKEDLPADQDQWESIFLAALGSPDATGRQIDGLGGGVSSNSKVAVISPSDDPRYDVVYYFGQVAVDKSDVDFTGNCGNIASAVAPFAIDEGLVQADEPLTSVRIHQYNTDTLIIAEANVENGRFASSGDYAISGINGTGSKITLRFVDPGGTVTGKLLPTGNVVDVLTDIDDLGDIVCSIVDAGNPIVFVKAEDMGIDLTDFSLFTETRVAERLESIRARTAVMLELAGTEAEASQSSQMVPKIAVVSEPSNYLTMAGDPIDRAEMDVLIRCMSMGILHKAMMGTAAICAAGAAQIAGSVVHDVLADKAVGSGVFRFGHPSGVMEVGSKVETINNQFHYQSATIFRTARRIMEGYVLVPENLV